MYIHQLPILYKYEYANNLNNDDITNNDTENIWV